MRSLVIRGKGFESCSKTERNHLLPYDWVLLSLVLFTLMAHPVKSFFLPGFSGLTYYCSYIAWAAYALFLLASGYLRLSNIKLLLVCILSFGSAVGLALGFSKYASAEWHQSLFIILATVSVLSSKPILTKKGISVIFFAVVCFGVFAALYAMVFQFDALRGVITGQNVDLNSWSYHSFFDQRNIFAEMTLFSLFAAGGSYYFSRKKRYLLCIALFLFQILITNSRSSTIVALLFIALLTFFSARRYRVFLVCLFSIIVILLLFSVDIYGYLSGYFTHYGTRTSNENRTDMWIQGLSLLSEGTAALFGYGAGSSSNALLITYGVGSFHNAYIEILFEGGVIRFICTAAILIGVAKSLATSRSVYAQGDAKAFWLPMLFAFCLHMLFESGCMPFASNYFSFM